MISDESFARQMPLNQDYALVSAFLMLMLAMQIKHFVADYLLQTNWMAQGKMRVRGWAVPLAAHAGMHGIGTLLVIAVAQPTYWWLGGVDFVVHGAIDRAKSLVGQRWPVPVSDARFWWLVGFDQFLHHVTSLGLVGAILLARTK